MRHQPITNDEQRLQVHMSWWGMTGIAAEGRPLDEEEKFQWIAGAGFDGIDAFIPELGESEQRWRHLLETYRLALSVNVYPTSVQTMRREMERAAAFGGISAVNVQVLTPFLTGNPAVQLLSELAAMAEEYRIPVNIETHRGTITQDLIRTAAYAEQVPQLRLTADLSHYVLAGEMLNVSEEAQSYIDPLLGRTDCIHARLSNGEQIQVDIGPNGSHPMLYQYGSWWKEAMRKWRLTHQEGGSFLFIPELGPPPYAITTDEPTGRKIEISDRPHQVLFLKDYARQLWKQSEL